MDHITGMIITLLVGNIVVRWVYSVVHGWVKR